MTEPDFVEATGPYDGRAWFGDIWTMRNLPIICGLEDLGRYDLAAQLTWSTVTTFNGNYCEYVVPSTGKGEGVQRYGWSASQYAQAIVEHLFGVDYDADATHGYQLRVTPNIPPVLYGHRVSLRNLQIPAGGDARLNIELLQSDARTAQVELTSTGQWQQCTVAVGIPVARNDVDVIADQEVSAKLRWPLPGTSGIAAVVMPLQPQQAIQFRPVRGTR